MNCPAAKAPGYQMAILRTKNYRDFQILSDAGSSEVLASGTTPEQMNHCLPGDEVVWSGEKCQLQYRSQHTLVGILEMKSKYIFGHTSRGNTIYICYPYDKSYPPFRVGCSEKNPTTNKIIVFSFAEWPSFEKFPRGNLLHTLGSVGDLTAEKLGLLWRYGRPDLVSKERKMLFPRPELNDHRPLLQGTTINIDPEGCRDIDDVLSLRQIEPTKWELGITIADVAAYVQKGSDLDLLAREKGQTLYQNGVAAVSMLPKILSEEKLSLISGQERQGVSLFAIWDTNLKTLYNFSFHETRLINNKSFSYENIYKTKEFPVDILQAIASHLRGKDTQDSHEWIEEMMILYNKKVAEMLLSYKVGLLRSHSQPKAEKVEAYLKIHPDLQFLAYKSAKYVPTEEGHTHALLGGTPYTHATSPLRRYADLVQQRALKAILHTEELERTSDELASSLNHYQRLQKHHDRDLYFLEKVIEKNTGTVEGIVMEQKEQRAKLYVPVWKRIVQVASENTLETGQIVKISYYANLEKPRWEERIVFRVDEN